MQKYREKKLMSNELIARIIICLFVAFAITGCKKKVSRSSISYVIGDDNMQTIQTDDPWYEKYKDAIDSSVLIVTKTPSGSSQFCSGVLVNGKVSVRVLTNHHCFAIKGDDGLATPELLSTACERTSIYFNVINGALNFVTKAKCVQGSLLNDFSADLASFSIEGVIPQNAKPIKLLTSPDVAGRSAFIIHYPADNKNFQYVSQFSAHLPVATITETDCKIIGKFPKDEWRQVPVLSVSHRHTCDLIQGSSGSPLIDLETKQLLGVNWGGIKVQSGGDLRTDNAATTAAYASEFLKSGGAANAVSSSLDALVKKSKQEATKERKDPACGAIGIPNSSNFAILLILLLPIGASFYIRKEKV